MEHLHNYTKSITLKTYMLPIMLGILCLNSKSRARCPKPNLEKHMFEHLFLDFNAVTLSFVSYQCVI